MNDPHTPFGILLLGLRVLGGELSWILVRAMRRLEIRQLQKRLREERALLERPGTDAADRELSSRQAAFLEEEIAFLAREMDAKRADMVARRTAAWGLEKEQA